MSVRLAKTLFVILIAIACVLIFFMFKNLNERIQVVNHTLDELNHTLDDIQRNVDKLEPKDLRRTE